MMDTKVKYTPATKMYQVRIDTMPECLLVLWFNESELCELRMQIGLAMLEGLTGDKGTR